MLSIPIYSPGNVPLRALLRDVSGRWTKYQHSISWRGWYESLTLEVPCRNDEALWWLDQLMAHTAVTDELMTVWEGCLVQVDAHLITGETRSRSIEKVANRIWQRFTSGIGTPGRSDLAQNNASQAQFGMHDLVLSSSSARSKTEATAAANRALAERAWPVATSAVGNDSTASSVTLTFRGWYATLAWVLTSRTDTTNDDSVQQVKILVGQTGQGYGGTNGFLSTDQSQIGRMGITNNGVSTSRTIDTDTSFQAAIEARLQLGDSNGAPFSWGVAEGRRFFVRSWSPALPNDQFDGPRRTHLRRRIDGRIVDLRGAPIRPWLMTPDSILVPAGIPNPPGNGSAIERGGRVAIGRVTCDLTPDGVAQLGLEPLANDTAAQRIGALR